MGQKKVRKVRVKSKTQLSPHWMRFILEGEDLNDFPEGFEGGYIKLLFKPEDASDAFDFFNFEFGKPIMRSYTITRFDSVKNELEFDFAYHGLTGPAAIWANDVEVGDQIHIVGPGPVKMSEADREFYFMAGDMTAVPAIKANLQQLSEKRSSETNSSEANSKTKNTPLKGVVFVEATSEEDIVEIDAPTGIEVNWLINPNPTQANEVLVNGVQSYPWPEGKVDVWCATEFNSMRKLRRYFKQVREVPRDQIYISSYWKIGDTDEQHKQAKKSDTEA